MNEMIRVALPLIHFSRMYNLQQKAIRFMKKNFTMITDSEHAEAVSFKIAALNYFE